MMASFFSSFSSNRSIRLRSNFGTFFSSKRTYVNILYRLPPQNTIPTHSPSGEAINGELFLEQVKDLISLLRTTRLTESIHEMRSCPYWESIFSSALIFQHYDMAIPMPKYNKEHRSSELSETLRYMRGAGASADFNHVLQDVKGGMADGRDFMSTTTRIVMAYGTSRTNKLCMLALTGSGDASQNNNNNNDTSQQTQGLNVAAIEMNPDAPPLTDLVGFSGNRTLIVKDNAHGNHAAAEITQRIRNIEWQVLKINPKCSFVTHLCGVSAVYDVICDEDFPDAMETIGEAGLNPFPCAWSEPRKLGISMPSVFLVGRFARGGLNAGGFADSNTHAHTQFNYFSKNMASNNRLFQGGRRVYGDMGAPFEAQIRSQELPEPRYQPPPRYAPPMHRGGTIVPK